MGRIGVRFYITLSVLQVQSLLFRHATSWSCAPCFVHGLNCSWTKTFPWILQSVCWLWSFKCSENWNSLSRSSKHNCWWWHLLGLCMPCGVMLGITSLWILHLLFLIWPHLEGDDKFSCCGSYPHLSVDVLLLFSYSSWKVSARILRKLDSLYLTPK